MEQNKLDGTNAGTSTAKVYGQAPSPTTENKERLFTRSEVIDIVKNRLNRRTEKTHSRFFERYGVKNLEELDNLFQSTRNINDYQQQINDLKNKNAESTRTIAFLKNNIDPTRYEDIIAHFKGTEREFSENALIEALATHPEWIAKSQVAQNDNTQPTTKINSVGVNSNQSTGTDEKEIASKIFGVQL